jgi:hypothetical protein
MSATRKFRRHGLPRTTYLYFIQAGERGPIKIGHSYDVEARMSDMQTSNAAKLVLLGKFPFDDGHAASYERKLHEYVFWDLRLNGEWFRCDSRILRLVREMQLIEQRFKGTDKSFTMRISTIDDNGEDFA